MDIMAPRTLADCHPALLEVLGAGMSVLDVGCGSGALTMEIARLVAPGAVVGMDVNPGMIRAAEAASPPGTIGNIVFYTGDVLASDWNGEFDVVNAARTLQWIPDPARAVERMARAAASGGLVVVLDVDHTKAEWSDPPPAWIRFYRAFLEWREALGLDNAITRHLPDLCEAASLVGAALQTMTTTVRADDRNFFRAAGRWRMLIESRGRQMVAAGHLTEKERRRAFGAFTEWMRDPNAVEIVHEACIIARRP